jgi:hypothetical protein
MKITAKGGCWLDQKLLLDYRQKQELEHVTYIIH